jgi:hypothetical protein
MLRITEESIVWLRSMKPIWEEVAKHDKNLARQMRDSAASVVGNLAEGEKRSADMSASGSARPTARRARPACGCSPRRRWGT